MGLRAVLWQLAFEGRSGKGLHRRIGKRLAAGTLPLASGRAYVSSASGGHVCACCGRRIFPRAIECDVFDEVQLYAHRNCFKVWVTESQRVNGQEDPRPSPDSSASDGAASPTREPT